MPGAPSGQALLARWPGTTHVQGSSSPHCTAMVWYRHHGTTQRACLLCACTCMHTQACQVTALASAADADRRVCKRCSHQAAQSGHACAPALAPPPPPPQPQPQPQPSLLHLPELNPCCARQVRPRTTAPSGVTPLSPTATSFRLHSLCGSTPATAWCRAEACGSHHHFSSRWGLAVAWRQGACRRTQARVGSRMQ